MPTASERDVRDEAIELSAPTQRRSRHPRSLLLLRAQDLTGEGPGPELDDRRRDHDILPLDAEAAAWLRREGIPFLMADEWLDRAGLGTDDLAAAASTARDGWAAMVAGTVSDVADTSLIDRRLAAILWREALLAGRLADAFDRAAITRVSVSGGAPGPDPESDLRQRTQLAVWSAALRGRLTIIEPPAPPISLLMRLRLRLSRSVLGPALRLARDGVSSARFALQVRRVTNGSDRPPILAVLTRREMDRSRMMLEAIAAAREERVILMPWEMSHEAARDACSLSPFPTIVPPIETLHRSRHRPMRGTSGPVAPWTPITTPAEESARAMPVIAPLLAELVDDARLRARRVRWLRTVVDRLRPAAVVTSRIGADSRPIIAAVAGLEVPVLTLPHAALDDDTARYVEIRGPVQHVAGIVDPTVPAGEVRRCPEAFHRYEYPQRVRPPETDAGAVARMTVLAVTEGFASGPLIAGHVGALTALEQVAQAVAATTRVLLKPHPGTPENEQEFLTPHPAPRTTVGLRRDLDLHALLADADVVIAVDAQGSALVHAVLAGLPLIRFWRSELDPDGEIRSGSAQVLQFWERHSMAAADAAELEALLERLRVDRAFRDACRARSVAAARELVPDEGGESVAGVIGDLLSSQVPRARRRS